MLDVIPSVKRVQCLDYFSDNVMSSHVYFLLSLPLTCTNEHSGCNVSVQFAHHTMLTIKTHLTAICRHFLQRCCCETFPRMSGGVLTIMSCSNTESM